MTRLLPRPGLPTGLVVAASAASGVAFGAAGAASAPALRAVVRAARGGP